MSAAKDLTSLTSKELNEFLDSFDYILCDVDGVVLYSHDAIPGSVEAIKTLRKLGKRILFVSNNCVRTLKEFHATLQDLGFDPEERGIINPSVVAIDYLKNHNFQKKIFLFTLCGFKKELQDAGYEVVDAHDVKIEDKDPRYVHLEMEKLDPDVGAVYLDIDLAFNYVALQQAVQYLKKPDTLLFGTARDRKLPASTTLQLIGPGCFFDIFKEMTGKEPLIFGKPERFMNDYIQQTVTDPARTIFIGDSMEQDINFAHSYGYRGLLVFSGISTKSDLENCRNEKLIPEYYVQDMKTFMSLIEQNK